jgi:hypothetical protein
VERQHAVRVFFGDTWRRDTRSLLAASTCGPSKREH